MVKDVVRWGKTDAYERTMIDLFDYPDPRTLIEKTEGRNHEQKAINAFVNRLRDYAEVSHVIKYRICSQDERRTLFYLVHGSNHFKGFKLMKDIMFNIGIPGTFAYLGPDQPDECQMLIDTWDSDVEYLKRFLMNKYAGMTRIFKAILEESYAEVPFIEKYFRAALLALEAEGKVTIFGFKRREGTLKYNHGIEFQS
jgi:hypothetical protein